MNWIKRFFNLADRHKYEFVEEDVSDCNANLVLRDRQNEGWELASDFYPKKSDNHHVIFYMKRKIR